jgi:nicotinate phosphoribosyltransferase
MPDAQKHALEVWVDEYPKQSKMALSDIWGMDAFLSDFSKGLAMSYTGCRQDSGDPYVWL